MSRTGNVCLVAAAMLIVLSAAPARAFSVRVERQSVVATEISRGGGAVFFNLGYVSGSVPTRVTTATVVADNDGDGVVELSPEGGVPLIGIWAVVDTATGDVQLASRRGYRLIDLDAPVEQSFTGDDDGRYTRFQHSGGDLELLVVRPGVGAWRFHVTDGGEDDGDYMANGAVTLPLEKLISLTPDAQQPVSLLDGDVVVVIDAGQMRASAGRLGRAK